MRSYIVGHYLFLSFGARHRVCLKLAVSVYGLSLACTMAAGKKLQQYSCSNLSSKNEEKAHKIVLNIQ